MREIFYMLEATGGIRPISFSRVALRRCKQLAAFKTKPPGIDRAAVHEAWEEGDIPLSLAGLAATYSSAS